MKELLFSVCVASLFSSVITFICPKGNEGIGKSLKLLCSLCVCACLIFPVMKLMKNDFEMSFSAPSIDESSGKESMSAYIDGTIENACREMERYVSFAFGVKDPILTLKTDKSNSEKVVIIEGHLEGEGSLEEAANYISSVLFCKITYEEG